MTTFATESPVEEAEALEAQRAGFLRGGGLLRAVRALSRSRIGTAGLVLVMFWVVVAVLAPVLAPHSAYELHPDQLNQPPSAQFLMGTDQYGRDILSRIIMGSRSVLVIAPLATLIGLVLGILIGLTAGYFGGIYDEIVMRIIDGFMAFPTLIILLLIISVVPPSATIVTIVVGVNFAPYSGRVVRSAVLAVRNLEFVEAAKMRGEPAPVIMVREVLPNCWRPIVVEGTTRVGYAIFAEAGLSFLGLGVPPPTPDWGVMVNEAQANMLFAPWAAIFPSLAIASLVIGVNLLADGIKQATVS
ncbi:MAG TPA: ABC transporter permease [Chloroflexota bacterium]|nr:ABC transporter permease [Chloroflexota bacterium]